MANPFDDEQGSYFVLVNDEGQHSLWPVFADVPAGWKVAYGDGTRTACLNFIEKTWTDLRPQSLVAEMNRRERAAEELSAS